MNDVEAAAPPPEPLTPLPLRAGEIDLFTPESAAELTPAPVFHLRVPSLGDRARIRRDCAALGAAVPPLDLQMAVIRRGIEEGVADAAERGRLSGLADAWADAQSLDAPDVTALLTAAIGWSEASAAIARVYPPFARLLADADYWHQIYPIILVRHMLVQAEHAATHWPGCEVTRRNGVTDEAALDALPRAVFLEIARRCNALASATPATRKN